MKIISNNPSDIFGTFEVLHNGKRYSYDSMFKRIVITVDGATNNTGDTFSSEITTIEGMKSAVYGIDRGLTLKSMVYVETMGNTQIGYIEEDIGNGCIRVVCMIDGKRHVTETVYDLVEKVFQV